MSDTGSWARASEQWLREDEMHFPRHSPDTFVPSAFRLHHTVKRLVLARLRTQQIPTPRPNPHRNKLRPGTRLIATARVCPQGTACPVSACVVLAAATVAVMARTTFQSAAQFSFLTDSTLLHSLKNTRAAAEAAI
ncbi:hypothetical protein B0H14DRAFT_2593929 [Mycena olivaceomarginata]|nr:hypothetical protein B0H14DRAFT_2593929 [Mycena olivaceomarginata]